jgi:hypothetical protein
MEHPQKRPHPKESGWTQEKYLAFAKPKDIAADLAEAAPMLSDWDKAAAFSLVCQFEEKGRLTVNQQSFATALIWRAWHLGTVKRCPCCTGRGYAHDNDIQRFVRNVAEPPEVRQESLALAHAAPEPKPATGTVVSLDDFLARRAARQGAA